MTPLAVLLTLALAGPLWDARADLQIDKVVRVDYANPIAAATEVCNFYALHFSQFSLDVPTTTFETCVSGVSASVARVPPHSLDIRGWGPGLPTINQSGALVRDPLDLDWQLLITPAVPIPTTVSPPQDLRIIDCG